MEVIDRQERDSHDLSYLATRFSVVDSMLSSLSGIPTANSALTDYTSSYPDLDDDLYSTAPKRVTTSNTSRRRGHTQSSVNNYDFDIDEISSRYTDYHSRGRANGTANLPRRTNRADNSRHNSILKRPSIDVREEQPTEAGMSGHTRGTAVKGSKGSGSSSMDLGYANGVPTGRFGHGPNRAASFDHSYSDRVPRSSPQRMLSNNNMVKSSTQPTFDYVNLDAAPTPTVPAGPRRPQEPLSPHLVSQPLPTPKSNAPSRKNSVKSTTSKAARKAKSNTMDPVLRDQAKQFVQASNNMRGVYAVNGPAPSPTVGGPRRQHPPVAVPQNPPKEKQGFFRRLFGSDKTNDDNRRPPSPPPLPNVPITNLKRPATQGNAQHITSQLKSGSRPSTQDAPPSSRDSAPNPTLKKSHSSFFRRRKKSISEPAPPVPQLQIQPQQSQPNLAKLNVNAPQISPSVSSLRKVMDPYLTENQNQSPDQVFFDTREQQPRAAQADETIRVVENGRLSPTAARTVVPPPDREIPVLEANGQTKGDESGERSDHRHGEVSQPQRKMRRGRVGVVSDNDGSFLADSSGNESIGGGDSPEDPNPPRFGEVHKFPRSTPAPTSSPYTSAYIYGSKENIPPPSRVAPTINQKPSLQVLSPISDRSQEPTPPSPPHDDEDDDEGYVVQSTLPREGSLKSHSSNRVWLEPSSSEEKLVERNSGFLKLPFEGPRTSDRPSAASDQLASPTSDGDVFISATSLPIVQAESREAQENWVDVDAAKAILMNDTDLTPADRERARMIFNGEEDFVIKAEAAAWLGQNTAKASRTRRAYMDLYDWAGYNVLAAFRELCGKLVVKAESQQLDRVIDAFSERWCSCNPSHGFKDRDVVHTITYSVLMLNTDLHIADLDQRMTRSQFVKNTLPTIRSIAEAAAAESQRKQSVHSRVNASFDNPSSPSSPVFPIEGRGSEDRTERPSLEVKRSRNRLSVRPPARQDSDGPDGPSNDNCNVLVSAPYNGAMKGWEFQVEIVLKEFYNSIRAQRLPLHGATQGQSEQSTNSLTVMANALRRTPSVLSKTPSDTVSYRGRAAGFKSATERFGPRRPSRPRIYPTSTVGSSRTSLDDQSVFSPSGSTWSKYSLGKTQTSLSVDSFGSHFAQGDYQQAIGFANALSQAIIREEAGSMGANSNSAGNGSEQEFGRSMPLLEDESLELVGAPWAKEGIVKHRHHLESLEKKAKDRGWSECFVVIEKGWMRLFSFNSSKSSSKSALQRQRAKSKSASSGPGAVVGGGNWTEKAEALGAFLLRQTIASALPPPGFSKSRPHVFALSLPNGAVHLFSVGTAEIVKEFVSTSNYWSARLSKEPLIGGVSNIEYGWSDTITAVAPQANSRSETASPTPGSAHGHGSVVLSLPRSSVVSPLQSPTHIPNGGMTSGRNSIDQVTGREFRTRLPGDKAQISEWTPPVQSMMASNLMEVDQLRALTNYVANVEDELRRHNELRALMGCSYTPRNPNATKAMANWEKKSAYLLREIVKFRTYIDSLSNAAQMRERIYRDREDREDKPCVDAGANGLQSEERAAVSRKVEGGETEGGGAAAAAD